eukprot:TCONS_00001038-protein
MKTCVLLLLAFCVALAIADFSYEENDDGSGSEELTCRQKLRQCLKGARGGWKRNQCRNRFNYCQWMENAGKVEIYNKCINDCSDARNSCEDDQFKCNMDVFKCKMAC